MNLKSRTFTSENGLLPCRKICFISSLNPCAGAVCLETFRRDLISYLYCLCFIPYITLLLSQLKHNTIHLKHTGKLWGNRIFLFRKLLGKSRISHRAPLQLCVFVLRDWRREETCTSWYRLWGMILTILFNLAWGNRGKRLSGQVQADL